MLLVSWNVNSLRARMPRVVELLHTHRPDVVALQETKTAPEAFPHLELQAEGYVSVDHSGGRWAGVALLVRDDHEVGETRAGLPGSPVPDEARWVEASVAGTTFVSTYVVNGRALHDPQYEIKLEFLDRVGDRVADLAERGPAAVLGDWNVAPTDDDVWDVEQVSGGTHVSAAERQRVAALGEHGVVDAWTVAPERGEHQFTWWDYRQGAFHRNLGMRIDLAMVTSDLVERLEWVGIDRDFRKGTKPSDHAPLLVRLD